MWTHSAPSLFSSIVRLVVGVMALLAAPPSYSCSCAAMAAAAATPIEHEDALRRRDLGGALLGGVEVVDVISCQICIICLDFLEILRTFLYISIL